LDGRPTKEARLAPTPVREARRAQILEAMYVVIAERGLMGASISEIAEAAGIARGALHYFFSSKEEITASLMRRLGERYLKDLEAWLEFRIERATAEPALRARLVADAVRWHFRGDVDEAHRRLGVWIDFWGHAANQPSIREAVVEVQEGARALLTRALLAERPELAPLDEPSRRAWGATLLALVEGGLLQWRVAAASPLALSRDGVGDAIAAAAAAAARSIAAPPPHTRIAA
jgi:TetR/AcrR family transcriptional regulator, transcriptional repressor of bet genes